MSDKRKVKILDVTPEIAERWLNATNNHNRPLRNRVVAKFAQAMKMGEWKLTAEPIAFSHPFIDSEGKQRGETLLNGQHRLWAIMDSGVTCPMTVWWGCEPDEFEVIDQGAMRTFGDVLATTRSELRDHPMVAGICTAFAIFGLGFVNRQDAPHIQLRHSHLKDMLRSLEPEIVAVVGYKKRLTKFAPRPVMSALLLSQIVNPAMTELIVSQLKDAAGFAERDPIRALHMRIVEQLTSGGNRETDHLMHYKTCHAISARLRGEHIKVLRTTAEGLAWLRDAGRAKIGPVATAIHGGKLPAAFYTPRIFIGEKAA